MKKEHKVELSGKSITIPICPKFKNGNHRWALHYKGEICLACGIKVTWKEKKRI